MLKLRTKKNQIKYFISIKATGDKGATFVEISKEGFIKSKKESFKWDQLMRLGKIVKG